MKQVGKTVKPMPWLLNFFKITGFPTAYLFFFPKIYYENKEKQGRKLKGGCIMMSNHTAFMDLIFFFLIFYERMIHFVTAEIQFQQNWFQTFMLYAFGSVYLDREKSGSQWVKQCLDILEHDGVVGMYPQGRLPVKGRDPFPFKPGIVTIAIRTDKPIIPVYIDGQYHLLKRARIIIGEPIYLKDHYDIANADKKMIREMTKFLENKNLALKAMMEEKMKAEKK